VVRRSYFVAVLVRAKLLPPLELGGEKLGPKIWSRGPKGAPARDLRQGETKRGVEFGGPFGHDDPPVEKARLEIRDRS